MTKKPVRKAEARDALAGIGCEDADHFLSEMIPLFRAWIHKQVKDNQEATSDDDDHTQRKSEAATSSSLLKTLENLDKLARSREKRGKKASMLDERQLMERFIRRMDQLLADGTKASVARKPLDR